MKTCTYCGCQMDDDAKFCTECGKAVQETTQEIPAPSEIQPETPQTEAAPQQKTFVQFTGGFANQEQTNGSYSAGSDPSSDADTGIGWDVTDKMAPEDISKNKGMAILAYFGFLVLIPLLAAKESHYARFHANQGLILFVLSIIWNIVKSVLSALFGGSSILGLIITILSWIGNIAIFALFVLGLINASQGKAKELPIIGGIRLVR